MVLYKAAEFSYIYHKAGEMENTQTRERYEEGEFIDVSPTGPSFWPVYLVAGRGVARHHLVPCDAQLLQVSAEAQHFHMTGEVVGISPELAIVGILLPCGMGNRRRVIDHQIRSHELI